MAKTKDDRPSPWLKKVLIPFWLLQLGVMLFILVLFIWLIAIDPKTFAVYQVLIVVLCAASIVLDVVEIILFARQKLKQLNYLIFQVVKSTIWFALFLNALVHGTVLQSKETHVDTSITWGVVIFGILFFTFLGSLIYGSVIYHRHRRNKRRGLNAQNITQNPYYHGPYGENGISNANYTPVHSNYATSAVGDRNSEYGAERVHAPYAENTAPAPAYVVGELAEADRKSEVKHTSTANELSATPEVYELYSPANMHTQGQGERW